MTMPAAIFWLRVLAVAQLALLAKRHLSLLEADERKRLAQLVAASKGRPGRNLSATERGELLRLAQKLEPAQFGRSALFAMRGRMRR